MKILVLSDSHRAYSLLTQIINDNKDSDAIVFLGDGERDLESAIAECEIDAYSLESKTRIYQVAGNCDFGSLESSRIIEDFDGVKTYMTHGHPEGVKYTFEHLIENARSLNCTLALYGHTHIPNHQAEAGVTLFNPGAVCEGRYGVITVENGTFKCEHKVAHRKLPF